MSPRRLTACALAALMVGATALSAHAAPGVDDAVSPASDTTRTVATPMLPHLHATPGVAITSVRKVAGLERTWEVTYRTDSVAPSQTFDSVMSLRITVPRSLTSASASRRYPVLYLLHGGGEGRVRDWTDESGRQGRAEQLTADLDLITVSLAGGKVSWYSDWVDQSAGAANWLSHHLDEVIPFIDANLPTLAQGRHRAIAGLSMGGYGAYHYAMERPGTFASVSSFSGGLDLGNVAIRGTVAQQLAANGFPRGAVWGTMLRGNPLLERANPTGSWGISRLAAQSRSGTRLAIYSGTGLGTADPGALVIEAAVGTTAAAMHLALLTHRVPHTYVRYTTRSFGGFRCDGGHDWGCWNADLAQDLPFIMRAIR